MVEVGGLVRPGEHGWRDLILSVVGPYCPRSVGSIMTALCVPDPSIKGGKGCLLGSPSIDSRRRISAGRLLALRCGKDDKRDVGQVLAGMDDFYQARRARLMDSKVSAAVWLVPYWEAWSVRIEDVLHQTKDLLQTSQDPQ